MADGGKVNTLLATKEDVVIRLASCLHIHFYLRYTYNTHALSLSLLAVCVLIISTSAAVHLVVYLLSVDNV